MVYGFSYMKHTVRMALFGKKETPLSLICKTI